MNSARPQFAVHQPWSLLGTRVPWAAHAGLGVLLSAGLFFGFRRFVTEHTVPLPFVPTLAMAGVLLAMAVGIRWAARNEILSWLPTVMLVVWAIVCSFPGSDLLACFVWGCAIALDLLLARRLVDRKSPTLAVTHRVDPAAPLVAAQTPLDQSHSNHPLGANQSLEDGETVLQQVMRVRDKGGREYIYATLRGEFEPGKRLATVYVGFCPPFAALPQVEAEVIEGASAVAKVVQSLHNGAQIEIDLDEPAMQTSHVTVEVAAFLHDEDVNDE